MEACKNSEILTKLYSERGENFEKYTDKELVSKENLLNNKIETELKKKYDNDENGLFNILNSITELCSINSEMYYKMGVADGFELYKEINRFSKKY